MGGKKIGMTCRIFYSEATWSLPAGLGNQGSFQSDVLLIPARPIATNGPRIAAEPASELPAAHAGFVAIWCVLREVGFQGGMRRTAGLPVHTPRSGSGIPALFLAPTPPTETGGARPLAHAWA